MAKHGFLYQGQRYSWQKHRRGSASLDLDPQRLVCYLQNHDQIANSATGGRIQRLTSAGRYRALTALLLLGPNTPLLFQGQEFAASAPFLYFADHKPELAEAVSKGRKEFMAQFPSVATIPKLPHPHDPATFERCKLDHSERQKHSEALALHRDLLRLRRELEPSAGIDGAVLGEEAFLLRFGDDRLLIVNLGRDLALDSFRSRCSRHHRTAGGSYRGRARRRSTADREPRRWRSMTIRAGVFRGRLPS